MKLFGLFGLLILLYCGCADRHRHKPFCEQELVDSLEVRVQDSLFSNVLYSRSQVRDALVQVQDSQVYYRLLALYGKTFFVSSDFDSILYYNRQVKQFSRNVSECPRWNDVLADVYNVEGNVWMQLNRPDSAILDYQKAYAYRLKGKRLHLLPDICINMAGGRVWGALFFLFMIFASFSTVLAVFENILAICMDTFGWNRKKATLIGGVALLVLSLPCVFGYNIWSNVHVIGARDILDSEDFIVSNLLLPIGSLVYLLFCVSKWGWGFDKYLAEANEGQGLKFSPKLKVYFQWILPILILIILIQGLL